jgi:hypothetical protein
VTRIAQCGFETGDVAQIGADVVGGNGGSVAVVASVPAARSGTYCLKTTFGAPPNATGGWAGSAFAGRKTITHASKTELWYAFGARFFHPVAEVTPGPAFFVAYDAAGNYNLVLTIEAGLIRAYYCTANAPTAVGTTIVLIAAASASLTMDAWHHLDVRIVAATGATGTVEVWLDGARVINATSVRTAQSSATLGSVSLGMTSAPVGQTAATAAAYHAYDDLRIQDTAGSVNAGRAGDESIRLLVPTGPGDATQLARGGTDSGANWSQVDEVPPTGSADYVSSDTVGQMDLYNLSTVAVASVSAVEVIVQGFNAGGGGSINLVTKSPAGQSDGSASSLTATPTLYKRLLETDPADAATWSSAKIDALQAGAKVAS